MNYTKPSQEHAAIISGKLALSEASKPVQSWFRLYLYLTAIKIARSGSDEEIESHAESYRDRLRKAVAYVKRKGLHKRR